MCDRAWQVRGEDGSLCVAKRVSRIGRSVGGCSRRTSQVDMVSLRDRERQAAQRECGLLRTLSHPHIVKYIDSYEEVRTHSRDDPRRRLRPTRWCW